MRRTRFDTANCPIARTADLLGDWWSPLILRDLMFGRCRFSDIQESLEISKGVLAQRLRRFEAEGIIERHEYQANPVRHEYRLTEKGKGLSDVVLMMWRYGETWLFDGEKAPVEMIDRGTGDPIDAILVDATTGEFLDPTNARIQLRR